MNESIRVEKSYNDFYFVSCVGKKKDFPCPARELYTSTWFVKARCYAESMGTPWYILSAKYGLVSPNQVIEPYDQTLNEMGKSERLAWANVVFSQILDIAPAIERVTFLAGLRYRENLSSLLFGKGIQIFVPMDGLRIGEQLKWLQEHSPHSVEL